MYGKWCAVCHSDDGTGRHASRPVQTIPMNFADCRRASAESDLDWSRVIRLGGPAAGRSAEMPSFEVLDDDQVHALVEHLRGFCTDTRWPRGDLKFPRAIFTAKAFPDDEVALQPMVSHGITTNTRVRIESRYETRVGPRAGIELGLPMETVGFEAARKTGVGDLAIGGKYVLYADVRRQVIVSSGLEVTLPSGSHRWEFGEGTAAFEPHVSAAMARGRLTLQSELRLLLPTHLFPTEPVRRLVYNGSISRLWSSAPLSWGLGAEINGVDRAIGLTPYLTKGLTRTGALTAAFGVRLPVTNPFPFDSDLVRWSGYLIWDFREPVRARP